MILEERTYTIVTGQVKEYLDMYEKEGKPIHLKYLGTPVGIKGKRRQHPYLVIVLSCFHVFLCIVLVRYLCGVCPQ